MEKESYLSISEFSEICGVSRGTLIYYDRIGLFKPAYVLPNGYRCYLHQQIETIVAIKMMSAVGASLEQIGQYLQCQQPETAVAVFRQQLEAVRTKLRELQDIEELLRIRIDRAEEALREHPDFQVVEQPAQPMFFPIPFAAPQRMCRILGGRNLFLPARPRRSRTCIPSAIS